MHLDDHSIEQLDQIAARVAKQRRLAHITRGDLAFEAGGGHEVGERIETGRPVAPEDLIAVLHGIEQRREGELHIPAPRTDPMPSSAATG